MQNPAENIRFTCRENDSKARAFNALRYRSSLARAGVHKATSVLQSAPVALSEAISVSYKPLSRRRIAETILPLAAYWLSLPSVAHPQTDFTKIVGKHFDHVVIVVMENEGTKQALADPNIAAIVKQGAWFSNYHGLAHPSLPNYLAIVAGSTFGLDSDHRPRPITSRNIVDRIEQKSLTWKSYAENYPGNCYLGSGAGEGYLTPKAKPTELYVRKHVPLLA